MFQFILFYSCFDHVAVVVYMNKVISKTDTLVCLIRFRREKEQARLLPYNWDTSSEKNTQTCIRSVPNNTVY